VSTEEAPDGKQRLRARSSFARRSPTEASLWAKKTKKTKKNKKNKNKEEKTEGELRKNKMGRNG